MWLLRGRERAGSKVGSAFEEHACGASDKKRSRVKKDFPSLKARVCFLYWLTMGKNFQIAKQNTAIQEI